MLPKYLLCEQHCEFEHCHQPATHPMPRAYASMISDALKVVYYVHCFCQMKLCSSFCVPFNLTSFMPWQTYELKEQSHAKLLNDQ